MKPYYEDNHIRIFNKDCRSMDELPDESVQCVCTSPPYYGLRKYSGDQELIWGDDHCEHEWGIKSKTVRHSKIWASSSPIENRPPEEKISIAQGQFCSLCGAWRGGLGLEPTPEQYLLHLIEILREIRRVLRKDGVCFVNIGDSYWGGKGLSGQGSAEYHKARTDKFIQRRGHHNIGGHGVTRPSDGRHPTIKPKDLCLIPQMLMISAREDGWWVRSVIIWSKNNPMPESVTDRPTESHEYILMLTKSARYYWDQEAVREKANPETQRSKSVNAGIADGNVFNGDRRQNYEKDRHTVTARNLRSVWSFPTRPYPEAHFAVFPEKLPELCIKAATPEVGCCSKCGAPWARITKVNVADYPKAKRAEPYSHSGKSTCLNVSHGENYKRSVETLGWHPTCKCNAARVPSLVLDPLMGAGTTLLVAKKLNRYAVGYEISQEYCQLAVERCRQQVLG